MSESPQPDLVKTTEVFLVPSSFLVAALGTADTNLHRAAVSTLGLVISILWWICSHEALHELSPKDGSHPRRVRIMSWLPIFFLVGWVVSVVGHLILWNKPLGQS